MQVEHEEWTYPDRRGVQIFAQSWVPAGETPRAAIQIVHGIGEHSGRYAEFAESLAAAGFAVFAEDHRGHGRTAVGQYGQQRDRWGYLGPGGLRATELAITELTRQIRARYPGLRVGVFAHSWGSLMAQRLLHRHWRQGTTRRPVWDAVALSGTALRIPGFIETGDLNARFPGPSGHEWISRDQAVCDAYLADPLTYRSNIRKQFGVADSLRLFGVPRRGTPPVPLLIVGGGDDALSLRNGRQRLAARYRRLGFSDVSVWIYPDARHEVLNELDAEKTRADITGWFAEKLSPAAPPARRAARA